MDYYPADNVLNRDFLDDVVAAFLMCPFLRVTPVPAKDKALKPKEWGSFCEHDMAWLGLGDLWAEPILPRTGGWHVSSQGITFLSQTLFCLFKYEYQ